MPCTDCGGRACSGRAWIHRGPGGAWITFRGIGVFHVWPDARRVDVYPQQEADDRVLGLLLVGQIAVFVLHQLGVPTLHASAVVTRYGAACFLGPKGQGKSTMAASFLHRGAAMLTDDVLPLCRLDGAICAHPSLPLMKLWRETAECTLQLAEELPRLVANYEKQLLTFDRPYADRFSLAAEPVRLSGFYLLERYDPAEAGETAVSIRRLGGREGVAVLLEQISDGAFLSPGEAARFLPIYAQAVTQAPVRVLRYPHGFEHQAAVHQQLLLDLAVGDLA